MTLITRIPSFTHLVLLDISQPTSMSQAETISKETIIIIFSHIKAKFAKFDIAVNLNLNSLLVKR